MESRWAIVKQKIKDLIANNASLKEENDALLEKVNALKEELEVCKQETAKTSMHSDVVPEFELIRTQLARKDLLLQAIDRDFQLAKDQITKLEESILMHESMIQVQKNTINELTEQNKLIKLAKEMSVTKADNHELKIKINELIRDIDRCIDLLND
jgi:chromosome segregation ATPase